MRIIKKILLFIFFIIVAALVAAIFIEKDINVERNITINKPASEVFNYVKYLKNQNEYSKWASMDTEMEKTFTGTDATPGFVSAWKSNNKDVGVGEQEIKKIEDGKRIDYEIRFKKPMEITSQSYMITESTAPDKTIVRWNVNGTMAYPFNLFKVLLSMEKSIGNDLQLGLNNLKRIQEQ